MMLDAVMMLAGSVLAQGGPEMDAGSMSVGSVFDFVRKGGIMMIPIGICSLLVVAVAAERSAVLRRSRVIPRSFERGLLELMRGSAGNGGGGGRTARQDALDHCRAHDSPAARMILAGLDKLGHSNEVVEKHLGAAGEQEVFLLRRRLRVLTVVTALAPLLGLTGTILGMITAFQTVATSGEALGRAELLAEGIYEAMITTAAGLIVAMPTLVVYHWLAGKVERLTRELDLLAVAFVERFVLEPDADGVDLVRAERGEPGGNAGDSFDASPARAGGVGGA